MVVTNKGGELISFLVSILKQAPAGETKLHYPVILKNVSDDDITMEVKLIDNKDYIKTVIYPGWNCEIVTAWKDAPADAIQYGY